jgi:hypothetical protein
MSAGYIGLAVSVIFLLATVTTIIALTNRAFAGHSAGAQQEHAAPAAAQTPAGQAPVQQDSTAGKTAPAQHAPGAH